jgi:aminoglycoside phosphotransferase (APT) family kinase protein
MGVSPLVSRESGAPRLSDRATLGTDSAAGPSTLPAMFSPVLLRLQTDAAAHFGTSDLRLVPLRWDERPFSYVLLVRVDRGDAALSHLYVKLFKPKPVDGRADGMRLRVARDFETTRRVHEAMVRYDDLGVVPPIACYPDHLAIVTERVDGPTLLEYLRTRASWFPGSAHLQDANETMARVGRWIRVFQAIDQACDTQPVGDLRGYVDIRLERLVARGGTGFTQARRLQVLEHIEALASRIPAGELRSVATHADMALGNILVSGRRVVVLDFAMAKRATRLHDLTRLYLQVGLLGLKPQMRAPVIRCLQHALVTGFDPALTPEQPLFRLSVLLHRVNHLTTLTLGHAPFPGALYNAFVRRHHQRWIDAEIAREAGAVRG